MSFDTYGVTTSQEASYECEGEPLTEVYLPHFELTFYLHCSIKPSQVFDQSAISEASELEIVDEDVSRERDLEEMTLSFQDESEQFLSQQTDALNYSKIADKWLLEKNAYIKIKRITRLGEFHPITEQGKQVIRASYKKDGVHQNSIMRLRLLLPSEQKLHDGEPEYAVIDGNHRVSVAQEMHFDDIEWRADIFKVYIKRLTSLCTKFIIGRNS